MEDSAHDAEDRHAKDEPTDQESSLPAPAEASNNDEGSRPGTEGKGAGEAGRDEDEEEEVSESVEPEPKSKDKHPFPSHLSGVHQLKWLPWKDSFLPIVTQNENGPCPLVALTNVLLLRGTMAIEPGETVVTVQQLSDMLGACLLESIPAELDADERSNYEQNLMDAMAVFPKLLTGLDINVKFDSVAGFEFTQELSIFDLLHVGLYHGWLADPSDPVYPVVAHCSYNQLAEMALSDATSDDTSKVQNALLAQQFLEMTASQLTYHGLYELSQHVMDGELCIFFRNNHFNTLFKRNDQMLLLVTDLGFIKEYGHVWHILSDIDDSGDFLDATFHLLPMPTVASSVKDGARTETEEPSERKELQEKGEEEPSMAHATSGQVTSAAALTLDVDHEIAMNLMQEQVMQAEKDQSEQSSHPVPPQPQPTSQNPVQRDALLGPPPTSRDEYEQAAQAYENQRRQSRQQSLCTVS